MHNKAILGYLSYLREWKREWSRLRVVSAGVAVERTARLSRGPTAETQMVSDFSEPRSSRPQIVLLKATPFEA